MKCCEAASNAMCFRLSISVELAALHLRPFRWFSKNNSELQRNGDICCSAVQYSTVQCCTLQYCAVQYSEVWDSAVRYGSEQCSMGQFSVVQCSAVQYSTVRFKAVQYSTGRDSAGAASLSLVSKVQGLHVKQPCMLLLRIAEREKATSRHNRFTGSSDCIVINQ